MGSLETSFFTEGVDFPVFPIPAVKDGGAGGGGGGGGAGVGAGVWASPRKWKMKVLSYQRYHHILIA